MRYYSTLRPIAPGTFPKFTYNKVINIVNFDSRIPCDEIDGQMAWGYIEYANPMITKEFTDYDLIPDIHRNFKYRTFQCTLNDDTGYSIIRISDGEIVERNTNIFKSVDIMKYIDSTYF